MVENQEMRNEAAGFAVRRDYRTAFLPDELANKFRSKQDLITYLSEHCKLSLFLV